MKLRIEIYGYGMDLHVAEITRDQMVRLEKSCTFFGRFYWKRSLQMLWYLNEKKMHEIFGVHSFRQLVAGNHRYLGPVLQKKSGLEAFLKGVKIFEDDTQLEIDTSRIPTRFQKPPPLPVLTDRNVVVCHGEYYSGTTGFEIQVNTPFSVKNLRLHFVDCGENGFILQKLDYKGSKALAVEEAEHRGFLKPQFIVK